MAGLLGQSDHQVKYAGAGYSSVHQKAAAKAETGTASSSPPDNADRQRGDRADRRSDPADGREARSDRREDRRAPDGRGGQRLRNDEIFRRPEGGSREGSHFNNDWAGRAILGRYLAGGGDWTINNDPAWSKYMMGNQTLREGLTGPTQEIAQTALRNAQAGGPSSATFDRTLHAEMQNGEGITGYEYLHGTNREVGDFQMKGQTQVTKLANGNYEVTLDSRYTWNDKIDPNPQYDTDTWKSRFAEVATLGRADPYDIHINWDAQSKVVLDPKGNVLSMSGYPAE